MLKRRLLVISLAALCLSTAPASANLFDFGFDALASSYDGGSVFSASANKDVGPGLPLPTSGSVTGFDGVTDIAEFNISTWGFYGGDFSLSMSISGLTESIAYGSGSFVITDTNGDTIIGDIAGTWYPMLDNVFVGTMSNVEFIDIGIADGYFDGHTAGKVQMDFISPPWEGTLIQLSSGGNWFTGGAYDTYSGGVLASVSGPATPVPTAVLLGIIGLGVAGLKLRKYA